MMSELIELRHWITDKAHPIIARWLEAQAIPSPGTHILSGAETILRLAQLGIDLRGQGQPIDFSVLADIKGSRRNPGYTIRKSQYPLLYTMLIELNTNEQQLEVISQLFETWIVAIGLRASGNQSNQMLAIPSASGSHEASEHKRAPGRSADAPQEEPSDREASPQESTDPEESGSSSEQAQDAQPEEPSAGPAAEPEEARHQTSEPAQEPGGEAEEAQKQAQEVRSSSPLASVWKGR